MAHIFLVVDGDDAHWDRTAKLLAASEPGCEVLRAETAPAAMALLESRRLAPSLIFADFAMPGMNMLEFLASVRGRRWLDGVRVAIFTGPIADKDVVNCYRLGACAFLTKPVSRYELRDVIGDWSRPARELNVEQTRPAMAAGKRFHVA